jgi:hypothetical protein
VRENNQDVKLLKNNPSLKMKRFIFNIYRRIEITSFYNNKFFYSIFNIRTIQSFVNYLIQLTQHYNTQLSKKLLTRSPRITNSI